MLIQLMTLLALIGLPTMSDARPGKTCSQACRRVASCKLLSYALYMDMCAEQGVEDTPESCASNLEQAKMSRSVLADQMAPSQWLCTAEGASSYGYGMDTSAMADVQGTQQLNNQRAMNLDDSQGESGAAVTSECHITQCIPPASARKNRQG